MIWDAIALIMTSLKQIIHLKMMHTLGYHTDISVIYLLLKATTLDDEFQQNDLRFNDNEIVCMYINLFLIQLHGNK